MRSSRAGQFAFDSAGSASPDCVGMFELVIRLIRDDSGQDLAEYMFLGAFIGVVSVLVWANIVTLLGDRYEEYNSNVNELWRTPEPSS